MTKVLHVTIGRNVNGKPMSDDEWTMFVRMVGTGVFMSQDIAENAKPTLEETHYGMGEWNGISEESAIISLITDNPLNEKMLKDWLIHMKHEFHQDAIAYQYAESELI